MSLDMYIISEPVELSTGIFVRENGKTKELSVEEVKERYPDIDTSRYYKEEYIYSHNITHNLTSMAAVAGLYEVLWKPLQLKEDYKDFFSFEEEDEFEENNTIIAKELIETIEIGLKKLKDSPEYYKQFNPENGWGTYEGLIEFTEDYLKWLKRYPNNKVKVSR